MMKMKHYYLFYRRKVLDKQTGKEVVLSEEQVRIFLLTNNSPYSLRLLESMLLHLESALPLDTIHINHSSICTLKIPPFILSIIERLERASKKMCDRVILTNIIEVYSFKGRNETSGQIGVCNQDGMAETKKAERAEEETR